MHLGLQAQQHQHPQILTVPLDGRVPSSAVPAARGHELLEGERGRRGRRSLGPQCSHELLVALAGLEGGAALGQGSEGAGTPLGLCTPQREQSQGHLRRGRVGVVKGEVALCGQGLARGVVRARGGATRRRGLHKGVTRQGVAKAR